MEYRIINITAEGSAVVVTIEITFTEDFKIITSFNMDEFNQKILDFNSILSGDPPIDDTVIV